MYDANITDNNNRIAIEISLYHRRDNVYSKTTFDLAI